MKLKLPLKATSGLIVDADGRRLADLNGLMASWVATELAEEMVSRVNNGKATNEFASLSTDNQLVLRKGKTKEFEDAFFAERVALDDTEQNRRLYRTGFVQGFNYVWELLTRKS